jgi:phosphomannomutase
MSKAQPVVVSLSEVSTMLWPNIQRRLSSSLKTLLGFNEMGESINEGEIGTNCESSAGLSLKGHHPEKDGISACLRAAKAVTSRDASLTKLSSVRDGSSVQF